MLTQLLYPYIKFTLGNLYPAYKTWKALKRKDDTNRRRWLKYWVSFAAFQMFELISDITLAFILPFYIELKIASILWLVLGTKLVFDSIVNRELSRREKSIDRWLTKVNKARSELVAMIWYEISRCSIKIVNAIMSGGLNVIFVKTPEQSNQPTPACSDTEMEDEDDDDDDDVARHQRRRQDTNNNITTNTMITSTPTATNTTYTKTRRTTRNITAAMMIKEEPMREEEEEAASERL